MVASDNEETGTLRGTKLPVTGRCDCQRTLTITSLTPNSVPISAAHEFFILCLSVALKSNLAILPRGRTAKTPVGTAKEMRQFPVALEKENGNELDRIEN